MTQVAGDADVESAAGGALQNVNVEVVFAHTQTKHTVPRLRSG
jgi:hypothetical protein